MPWLQPLRGTACVRARAKVRRGLRLCCLVPSAHAAVSAGVPVSRSRARASSPCCRDLAAHGALFPSPGGRAGLRQAGSAVSLLESWPKVYSSRPSVDSISTWFPVTSITCHKMNPDSHRHTPPTYLASRVGPAWIRGGLRTEPAARDGDLCLQPQGALG